MLLLIITRNLNVSVNTKKILKWRAGQNQYSKKHRQNKHSEKAGATNWNRLKKSHTLNTLSEGGNKEQHKPIKGAAEYINGGKNIQRQEVKQKMNQTKQKKTKQKLKAITQC